MIKLLVPLICCVEESAPVRQSTSTTSKGAGIGPVVADVADTVSRGSKGPSDRHIICCDGFGGGDRRVRHLKFRALH
jgi:hypothetical protein